MNSAYTNYNADGDLVSYKGIVIDWVAEEWNCEIQDLVDSKTPWRVCQSKGEKEYVVSRGGGMPPADANFPKETILGAYATLKEAQAAHPEATTLTRRAKGAVEHGFK